MPQNVHDYLDQSDALKAFDVSLRANLMPNVNFLRIVPYYIYSYCISTNANAN